MRRVSTIRCQDSRSSAKRTMVSAFSTTFYVISPGCPAMTHLPGDRGPAQLLGAMRHLELSRDIRAAWQYNNLCYNVLGLLIERISGQSYASFIRSRLTDRLGMKLSFTLEALEASSEAARPYMMHEDLRLPAIRLPISTMAGG